MDTENKNIKETSLSIKDKLEVLRKILNTTNYDCNVLINEIEVEIEKLLEDKNENN